LEKATYNEWFVGEPDIHETIERRSGALLLQEREVVDEAEATSEL
jgi:hypothetical protein